MVTALGVGGPVTITATYGFVAQSITITVTSATLQSLSLSDTESGSIALDTTDQLTAVGVFDDGSSQDLSADVTWQSADSTTIVIDSTGLATAVAVGGPIAITASFGNVNQTINLTGTEAVLVAISVSDQEGGIIAAGTTDQLAAYGTFSDGTSQDLTNSVTWTTADANVVSVDQTGLVNASGAGGPVQVTATSGNISSVHQHHRQPGNTRVADIIGQRVCNHPHRYHGPAERPGWLQRW